MTKVNSTEKMWEIKKRWFLGFGDKRASKDAVLGSGLSEVRNNEANMKKAKVKARYAQLGPPRLKTEPKEGT